MAKQTQAGRKPAGMKIKKGDTVMVLAGRDRGREGKVIAAYPSRQRVLVQGVNVIRKNTKVNFQGARGAKEGGIVTQEAPIHVSNVALVDPDTRGDPSSPLRWTSKSTGHLADALAGPATDQLRTYTDRVMVVLESRTMTAPERLEEVARTAGLADDLGALLLFTMILIVACSTVVMASPSQLPQARS